MKRKIVAAVAATALTVGFSAMSASAYGWSNGGHMMDPGVMNNGAFDRNISTQFRDEVRSTHNKITADQIELNALRTGNTPDKQRVRELSESIATSQIALEEKYRASGYNYQGSRNSHHMSEPGVMNYSYRCMW